MSSARLSCSLVFPHSSNLLISLVNNPSYWQPCLSSLLLLVPSPCRTHSDSLCMTQTNLTSASQLVTVCGNIRRSKTRARLLTIVSSLILTPAHWRPLPTCWLLRIACHCLRCCPANIYYEIYILYSDCESCFEVQHFKGISTKPDTFGFMTCPSWCMYGTWHKNWNPSSKTSKNTKHS